jgi:pyrrolidone-carboxylate peptidase
VKIRVLVAFVSLMPLACATSASDDDVGTGADEVIVDTSNPAARAQYDANVRLATSYVARCKPTSERPRVLVTGFGRFLSNPTNATGMIVSTLVPEARYPMTSPPPTGEVDPPEPQLSVAVGTVHLAKTGDVDVCAMILPVYWDLAAILVAKELDSFKPQFVLMNGIAGGRQPIWLELGSINRAMGEVDGSNVLTPKIPAGQTHAQLVKHEPLDHQQRLLLSYAEVQAAAEATVRERSDVTFEGVRFGDVVQGAKKPVFPRRSNTYLCNNLSYLVSYMMDRPGKGVGLLRASDPKPFAVNGVTARVRSDFRGTPRVFVHWPSELRGDLLGAGAALMASVIDAQLVALARGQAPVPGDNSLADVDGGGDTF